MSFREKIDCIAFALKLCRGFSKKFYLYFAINCFFGAAEPLVPTWFSARIVDELAGGRDIKKLVTLGVLLAVLTAHCDFLRRVSVHGFYETLNLLHDFEGKVFEKHIVGVDYELLEDADYQNAVKSYKVIYENNFGIYYNMWYYAKNFVCGILAFLFSRIIIWPSVRECFAIDNSSFMSSWKPIIILVAAVALIGVIMAVIGHFYSYKLQNQSKIHFHICSL